MKGNVFQTQVLEQLHQHGFTVDEHNPGSDYRFRILHNGQLVADQVSTLMLGSFLAGLNWRAKSKLAESAGAS